MFDEWTIGTCDECGIGGLHTTRIGDGRYCQDCKYEPAYIVLMENVQLLKDKLNQQERELDILSRRIVPMCGTCPADSEGWEHTKGCGNVCNNTETIEVTCWREWARVKANEEHEAQELQRSER